MSEDLFLSSTIAFDEIKMHLARKEEDRIPEHESAKKLGFPGEIAFRLVDQGRKKQEDMPSLGEIASGKKAGRKNDQENFILIFGGLPVEDAAWGYALYQNALKMGIGQELVLWDSPHWA